MKILITGAGSFLGEEVNKWLKEHGDYEVDIIDTKCDAWKEHDFSGYDSVYHVAGIAHADVEKVSKDTKSLYYAVNCDLAYDCAKKAKDFGVGQFIFMSSMLVFPSTPVYGTKNVITKDTKPAPDNFYGDSKLQAERRLNTLRDDKFKIVILRPPMIYGKGSKGNYKTLAKLALKMPVFPKVKNERSMLYVENLCEFVRLMIVNREDGTFYPQNIEYVNTTDLSREIASAHGKKLHTTGLFSPALWLISKMNNKYGHMVCKAFGSLVYDKSLSFYKDNYCLYNFKESVLRTEKD